MIPALIYCSALAMFPPSPGEELLRELEKRLVPKAVLQQRLDALEEANRQLGEKLDRELARLKQWRREMDEMRKEGEQMLRRLQEHRDRVLKEYERKRSAGDQP